MWSNILDRDMYHIVRHLPINSPICNNIKKKITLYLTFVQKIKNAIANAPHGLEQTYLLIPHLSSLCSCTPDISEQFKNRHFLPYIVQFTQVSTFHDFHNLLCHAFTNAWNLTCLLWTDWKHRVKGLCGLKQILMVVLIIKLLLCYNLNDINNVNIVI